MPTPVVHFCSSQDSEDNRNLSLHQLLQLHQEPEQDQKAVLVTPPVGGKVTTRARAASLPQPQLPPLPPRRCQLLSAARRSQPVAPPRCRCCSGRAEGRAAPDLPGSTGLAPPALACGAASCALVSALLSRSLPGLVLEFLFKITETVL